MDCLLNAAFIKTVGVYTVQYVHVSNLTPRISFCTCQSITITASLTLTAGRAGRTERRKSLFLIEHQWNYSLNRRFNYDAVRAHILVHVCMAHTTRAKLNWREAHDLLQFAALSILLSGMAHLPNQIRQIEAHSVQPQ